MKMRVEGLSYLVNRLEKFDKDVSKELKTEMKAAGADLVSSAQGLYFDNALTNWGAWTYVGARGARDVSFSAPRARAGVKIKANRFRRRGATVGFGYSAVQTNAGAAILEFAGSQSDNRFTQAITDAWGKASVVPRILGIAYYETAPSVRAKMEAAVESAMRKVGL